VRQNTLALRLAAPFLGMALGLGLVSIASGQGKDKDKDKELGATFLGDAVRCSLTAIELGKLGQQFGTRYEVKAFALRLADEQLRLGEDVRTVATRRGVALPTEPNAHQKKTIEKLKTLKGVDFDKGFADAVADDIGGAASLFEVQASGSQDAELRALASRNLPVLKNELSTAKALHGSPSG